jgi:hypothetical protein
MTHVPFLYLPLTALAVLSIACDLADDVYYPATKSVEQTWTVGGSPGVAVAAFEGGIWVVPGDSGVIKVTVEVLSTSKKSKVVAQRLTDSLDVHLRREGDSITVAITPNARYTKFSSVTASIRIEVPSGIRLDLSTDRGDIWVGYDRSGIIRRVSPVSIKARGNGIGNAIGIMTLPKPHIDAATVSRREIVIQDSTSNVLIHASDYALSVATAGRVNFTGTPARGVNTIYAGDAISLELLSNVWFYADHSAEPGALVREPVHKRAERDGVKRLTGALHDGSDFVLELHSQSGVIHGLPESTNRGRVGHSSIQ